MLSICIPVYNFDVKKLTDSLSQQAVALQIPFEILLIDDASTLHKEANKNILENENVRWVWLPENIGRSKIRNLLAKEAKYLHLLFLDCDVWIENPKFIANYISAIQSNSNAVICGGRIYPSICPSSEQFLSWNYGMKRESKPAFVREKQPYFSFMTNNFIIPKSVFSHIIFDENISGYGHEDTLFGIALKQQHIPILHIENPVLNADIETNEIYLKKTQNAISNLKKIKQKNIAESEQYLSSIKLLKAVNMIEKVQLGFVFRTSAFVLLPFFKEQSYSTDGKLIYFDLYKLFYYFSVD